MMVIIILPFHRDGEAHLQGILDTVKCHLLFSLSLFLRQLMTAPGSFFVIPAKALTSELMANITYTTSQILLPKFSSITTSNHTT